MLWINARIRFGLLGGPTENDRRGKGPAHIRAAAERLETAVVHDADLLKLVEITQELLDLCRTVQRSVHPTPDLHFKKLITIQLTRYLLNNHLV